MAVVVVESSALISFLKGDENPLLEMALEAMAVQIPPLVATEILGNPISSKDRPSLERLFELLPFCPTNREHFEKAAKLKAACEARGFGISARDAHIAQCALDQNALLLSKDRFFLEVAKYCGVNVQV